jgi:hypothetical protein
MLWLVRSAMVAFYPRTEALPGLADAGIDPFLRQFRSETTLMMWLGVVLAALLFHLTPLFTTFVPLPAFLLPSGLRDKHARRIGNTNLYLVKQAMLVLKLPAGLCWGRDPEVRKRFAMSAYAPDPESWRTT